ncbi:glucose-6-phosphate dehydrogenase (NADP(+)) [Aquifex aeolicus]|uniref:Glucose-6-phosphate 1-dehydrogenase n=2 Tax=Aquifex aeolicus TaxID=63363 RepID=O66787_AQUAE|nr:glucose-6-phosphate dehydrogenase (NADP(+)) [Aquifex aeolicus]AAC06740.1 glucose-6-phosphate 1-dehydrogenase [Aquifex aeolicus VF5]AAO61692.1 glucose-6-phosphate dehydrogenase [Aquifex aeolicus]
MSSGDTELRKRIEFIIFGGTGDLSRNKLIPAILKLKDKIDLKKIYILGRNRKKFEEIKEKFKDFSELFVFVEFLAEREESYKNISSILGKESLKVFYLAVPPDLFKEILENVGKYLNFPEKRIVIEKPFGLSLKHAKDLNKIISVYFKEEEIFRIDHYLGKPQVQNILAFKFSNYVFSEVLNKCLVEKVEVIALEEVGVEGRKAYYEKVGVIRDMLQNHMLLLSSLIVMRLPPRAEDFHFELKNALKRAEFESESLILGKYKSYQGKAPTFALVKLHFDDERFTGVPFVLATGKKLKKKLTRVCIHFKNFPKEIERLLGCVPERNLLVFELYPEQEVSFRVNVISPLGFLRCTESINWRVSLKDVLGEIPEAYESLLLDVIRGDKTLFLDAEETEILWEKTEPLLKKEKEVLTYDDRVLIPEFAEDFISCL